MSLVRTLIGSGLALGVASSAHASIVANFDGGSGDTQVDQFIGMAGDGWVDGWNQGFTGNSVTSTQTVQSSNPINGGGNYLNIRNEVTSTPGGNGQTRVGTSREYADFGAVDLTDTVIYTFDLRVDEATGFTNAFNDTIELLASTSSTTTNAGSNSNTSWQVQFRGNGAIFYRDSTANVNSGATWDVGSVYSFEIVSDAVTETYDLSILDDGVSIVDVTGLSWRAAGSLVNEQPQFFAVVPGLFRSSDGANLGDVIDVSVDNISIAIPEPASLALLGLGLGVMALRPKRS
ncbi:MAG: PEP-CTERM sorting domain-containing protein [Planctomycetota bacterium]